MPNMIQELVDRVTDKALENIREKVVSLIHAEITDQLADSVVRITNNNGGAIDVIMPVDYKEKFTDHMDYVKPDEAFLLEQLEQNPSGLTVKEIKKAFGLKKTHNVYCMISAARKLTTRKIKCFSKGNGQTRYVLL